MKNDRIDILMDYTFVSPKTNKEYEEQVYVPTEIFCEAVRQYIYRRCDVNLDGTDSSILSLLSEFEDGFSRFEYDDDFLDVCRELYENSSYVDDDLEEVLNSWENEDDE